jgi:hypothetical protein
MGYGKLARLYSLVRFKVRGTVHAVFFTLPNQRHPLVSTDQYVAEMTNLRAKFTNIFYVSFVEFLIITYVTMKSMSLLAVDNVSILVWSLLRSSKTRFKYPLFSSVGFVCRDTGTQGCGFGG